MQLAGLILFLVVISSCQSLFCRKYTEARRGEGALAFTVLYSATVGIISLAVNGFAFRASASTLVLGLCNAAALLTYNISMQRACATGSYAFTMICMLSGSILLPMVYELLFRGMGFTPVQVFAVALLIASFVLMNLDGVREKKKWNYLLWVALLFTANGAYSILLNMQQTANQYTQRSEMLITTYLVTALATALFEMIFARKSFLTELRMKKKHLLFIVLSAACAATASSFVMYAMRTVPNVTILYAVHSGGVLVLSTVFAFTIFREKFTLPKGIGILVACASIVLLSL